MIVLSTSSVPLLTVLNLSLFPGATRTQDARELLYARQKVVVTSKAFGLQAIDLVYIDYKDVEGLRRQAREGALMGFTGKALLPSVPAPSICIISTRDLSVFLHISLMTSSIFTCTTGTLIDSFASPASRPVSCSNEGVFPWLPSSTSLFM